MIPRIEKVSPAGVKILGYMSDKAPVVFPHRGRAFAR
jgi:hypothetical protein